MKNDKDIIAVVKSRRDVILVETPTVIREILRYGFTFSFVQYPYHVPTGLWRGEDMLFYPHYIPDGIDFQGYYANLSLRVAYEKYSNKRRYDNRDMKFVKIKHPVRDASLCRKILAPNSLHAVGM